MIGQPSGKVRNERYGDIEMFFTSDQAIELGHFWSADDGLRMMDDGPRMAMDAPSGELAYG